MNMKKLRFNKTWAVLVAALTVGLLAALGANSYIKQKLAEIEKSRQQQGKSVQLVVATRDLNGGDIITRNVVANRDIPAEFNQSNAITENDFKLIENRALANPVKRGEIIMWSMIEGKKAPTFSSYVNDGRRAMTFPVDEINSISGMLEPGDRIDLIITLDRDGRKATFPFLQNMKVLATGQRVADDPRTGERRNYTTVTLDTSPEEAQTIVVARNNGKINALLRNPQDETALAGVRDLTTLLDSSNFTPPQPRVIPVLYGGKRGYKNSDLNLRQPDASEATFGQDSGLRYTFTPPTPENPLATFSLTPTENVDPFQTPAPTPAATQAPFTTTLQAPFNATASIPLGQDSVAHAFSNPLKQPNRK